MRHFVTGLLLWGIVTNTLYFLPPPRNLPVALCKHGDLFFPLQVSFDTKDDSLSGGGKTDSLLLAGGVLSLISAFYSFSWFIVQQGRRNAVRGYSAYVVLPVFSMSVATLLLFSVSIMQNKGCVVASGVFLKIAEIAGVVVFYITNTERGGAVKQKVEGPRKPRPSPQPSASQWDPASVNLGFK